MSAFDLAGTDGIPLLRKALIIDSLSKPCEIPNQPPYSLMRCFGIARLKFFLDLFNVSLTDCLSSWLYPGCAVLSTDSQGFSRLIKMIF